MTAPDTETTIVIFRTFRKDGETYALFPELPGDHGGRYCSTYAHLGQHGSGYPGATPLTRPATAEEITPLRRELESIGYKLEIRKKFTAAMDRKRWKALDQINRSTSPRK